MKIGPFDPFVCIRTVEIPSENEQAFFEWLQANRALRERYGVLLERILRPSDRKGEWLILTMWASEEAFEKYLVTPEKKRVDDCPVVALINFGKVNRYDTVAGF